jgi:hypothetical protein
LISTFVAPNTNTRQLVKDLTYILDVELFFPLLGSERDLKFFSISSVPFVIPSSWSGGGDPPPIIILLTC